jgi:hypothetical protein
MTVYELIQRLTEFPSDAEVDFELQKSFGWPAVVDTDEGTRLVTANVSLNESKDDFSHGYVAGYYDCINKIKKLNGLG